MKSCERTTVREQVSVMTWRVKGQKGIEMKMSNSREWKWSTMFWSSNCVPRLWFTARIRYDDNEQGHVIGTCLQLGTLRTHHNLLTGHKTAK